MGNENQYKLGEKVISALHGQGNVYLITEDKDYPVIVKFKRCPFVNYYYTQEGIGVNDDHGDIQKATL